jgi:hypothetical protein
MASACFLWLFCSVDLESTIRRSETAATIRGADMRIQDRHVLPKFSDGWSYLYVEHCGIEQEDRAIAIHDKSGKVPFPCANMALLMLGPGVSITHAAISVLADHGCLVAWCGEGGVRFYALGMDALEVVDCNRVVPTRVGVNR